MVLGKMEATAEARLQMDTLYGGLAKMAAKRERLKGQEPRNAKGPQTVQGKKPKPDSERGGEINHGEESPEDTDSQSAQPGAKVEPEPQPHVSELSGDAGQKEGAPARPSGPGF